LKIQSDLTSVNDDSGQFKFEDDEGDEDQEEPGELRKSIMSEFASNLKKLKSPGPKNFDILHNE
jgi:hypothetical protein